MILSKREWKVLREAADLLAYWWAPKTCASLAQKGLMDKYSRSYSISDAGRALIAQADETRRGILADTKEQSQ